MGVEVRGVNRNVCSETSSVIDRRGYVAQESFTTYGLRMEVEAGVYEPVDTATFTQANNEMWTAVRDDLKEVRVA